MEERVRVSEREKAHLHLNKHIIPLIIADAVDVVTNVQHNHRNKMHSIIILSLLWMHLVTHDKPHSMFNSPHKMTWDFAFQLWNIEYFFPIFHYRVDEKCDGFFSEWMDGCCCDAGWWVHHEIGCLEFWMKIRRIRSFLGTKIKNSRNVINIFIHKKLREHEEFHWMNRKKEKSHKNEIFCGKSANSGSSNFFSFLAVQGTSLLRVHEKNRKA